MLRRVFVWLGLATAVVAACAGPRGAEPSTGGHHPGATASASTAGGSGGSGGTGGIFLSVADSGLKPKPCGQDPAVDGDLDGWTPAEGDCNDCNSDINPGAVDVMVNGQGADMNCDGKVDLPAPCDDNLAFDDDDPLNAARAIELCQMADPSPADPKARTWGVLSARWIGANGSDPRVPDLQAGIQAGFGDAVHTQAGERLLALSTGHARLPDQPGACGAKSCTTTSNVDPPAGFPQVVPGCDGGTIINDDIALEVAVRVPTNATGYAFDFRFFSFEFPKWICTPYNDQFVALASPPPPGSIGGNLIFDSAHNPVSVNLAFFDTCDPMTSGDFATVCGAPQNPACPLPPTPYCPLGPGDLAGTGFDVWGESGATRWLTTRAPAQRGETLTLRFAIWDTSDQALDSTVVIDHFQWITGEVVSLGTAPTNDFK